MSLGPVGPGLRVEPAVQLEAGFVGLYDIAKQGYLVLIKLERVSPGDCLNPRPSVYHIVSRKYR